VPVAGAVVVACTVVGVTEIVACVVGSVNEPVVTVTVVAGIPVALTVMGCVTVVVVEQAGARTSNGINRANVATLSLIQIFIISSLMFISKNHCNTVIIAIFNAIRRLNSRRKIQP
jgi:hypothetical protein